MKYENYQTHLDRVSRSFAVCIKQLEAPFKHWVGLTYLVCRMLDTVEDSSWKKLSCQLKQFLQFDQFLLKGTSNDQLLHWKKAFPKDVPVAEKLLLNDAQMIFDDIHNSPKNIRVIIQEMVASMSAGMQFFVSRKESGVLKLNNLKEVNQYCFFVAGIVGETLAKLFEAVDSRVHISKELIVDAHHFGLFLQKVNLLKDQLGDEKEGRFLIPSRRIVEQSLFKNADGAMRYLRSLPCDQKGYRLFCAWSLFLGLVSLPYIKRSYQEKKPLKISRTQTLYLFKKIEGLIGDPQKLDAMFEELLEKSGLEKDFCSSEIRQDLVNKEFKKHYFGLLENNDLIQLGLI